MRATLCVALLLPFAAACGSLRSDVDSRLVDATAGWVAEPAAFGRDAEWFEVEEGAGSMTGWFLRAPESQGRTVLLFHGNRANATTMHPWYSFLLDAGLNVCVFDYRGFGRSKGAPGLAAMVYDLPALMEWLRARPDVDPEHIAFYGFGIGGVVALKEAVRSGAAALVLENVPSPLGLLENGADDGDEPIGSVQAAVLEFGGIPEDAEPEQNARRLSMPSLWLAGADLPQHRLRALLAAYVAMKGDKQLWVLPGTLDTPHALMTHDGEYQRTIATFLTSALAGAPETIAVDWKKANAATGGGAWWDVQLQRKHAGGGSGAEPWCVEVCAMDANAAPQWQGFVVDGDQRTVRMRLEAEPGVIGAARIVDAERLPGGGFRRTESPLQRAGAFYRQIASDVDLVRNASDPDPAKVLGLAQAIELQEIEAPLLPQLEHELADVFVLIGRTLAKEPSRRQDAERWLRRGLAAIPPEPEKHFWPYPPATFGFPADRVRQDAEQALASLR